MATTGKIDTLLCAMPLEERHRELLYKRLPDTEILYGGYMRTPAEDVRRAQVIFGNVVPEQIRLAENLQWIQLGSAGADEYVPAVPENVLLTNATGGYGETISEHILAMLLMLQKKLHIYHDNMKDGKWKKMGNVLSISGSVCLVLGMGDIGGRFAEKAKMLGAYIIGIRRSDMRKPNYCDELYTMERIDELLPRADSVIMALPNTPHTQGVIDKRRFALMKKTCILINVGRGGAVIKEDLIDALNSGKIWGAGIDVACPEPLPADDPLWRAENLIITPHTSGGWTLPKNLDDVMEIFLCNLDRWEKGEPLKNIVDRETGYAKKDV